MPFSLPPQRFSRGPVFLRRLLVFGILYFGALYLFQRFIARPSTPTAPQGQAVTPRPAPLPVLRSARPPRVESVSASAVSAASTVPQVDLWLYWQTEAARDLLLFTSVASEAQWKDMGLGFRATLHIAPRAGIRALMGCFPHVPPFRRLPAGSLRGTACLGSIAFVGKDGTPQAWVDVWRGQHRAFLYRGEGIGTPIPDSDASRFHTMLRTVLAKARRQEAGYSLHVDRDV